MNNSPTLTASLFLVNFIFDFYLLIVILRILLQRLGANYHNPLCQFLIRMTDPILKPCGKIIPKLAGFNIAAIVLALVVELLKLNAIALIQGASVSNIPGMLLWGIGDLLGYVVNIFFYGIIIQVILSWVGSQHYNPAIEIIHTITQPLLAPARRIIKPIGGLDLSPVLVLLALQLVAILLIRPLEVRGMMLVLGL